MDNDTDHGEFYNYNDLSNLPAYSTPEEAALASYEPVSKARVVDVGQAQDADHVVVYVDTDPSYVMRCYCIRRRDGRWVYVGDSN